MIRDDGGGCLSVVMPTVGDMIAHGLGSEWREVDTTPALRRMGGRAFVARSLRVIATVEDRGGAGLWWHTSTTRTNGKRPGLPSWDDLSLVKRAFHEDRAVVQVIPPRRAYVDLVDALHLWERLDAPTVPAALWEDM